MRLASLIATLFFGAGAWAQNTPPVDIAKILACHKAYKPYADSSTYDIHEHEGLAFVRRFENVPNAKPPQEAFALSLTDGQNVYGVHIPLPIEKNSEGKDVAIGYHRDHSFKLTIPSGDAPKTYCVTINLNMLERDNVKLFKPSPPESCDDFRPVTAQLRTDKALQNSLRDFQLRIYDNLRSQISMASDVLDENRRPSQSGLEAAKRLAPFQGTPCRDLPFKTLIGDHTIGAQLEKLDKIRSQLQSSPAPLQPPSPPGARPGINGGTR